MKFCLSILLLSASLEVHAFSCLEHIANIYQYGNLKFEIDHINPLEIYLQRNTHDRDYLGRGTEGAIFVSYSKEKKDLIVEKEFQDLYSKLPSPEGADQNKASLISIKTIMEENSISGIRVVDVYGQKI